MGKVTYYLATSEDGKIADTNGSVSWLDPFHAPLNTPYDYLPFYETVDAVVMGRKTLEIVQSLGKYPYPGKPGWIFSKNPSLDLPKSSPSLLLKNQIDPDEVRRLRDDHANRIWLVGGGDLAAQFIKHGLLDEIIQTVVPVKLGQGIPWLAGQKLESTWVVSKVFRSAEGVIQTVMNIIR